MKKGLTMLAMLGLTVIVFMGCSGSKAIQNTWRVQNATGENYSMEIKDKEIKIKNGSNNETLAYTQNAIGTENGIKYYGLTIDNQKYSIIFPEKGNSDVALFMKVKNEDDYLSGVMMYAMNLKEDPDYRDYAATYIKN